MLRTKRGNRILALLLVVLIAFSQTALASAEDGGTMVVTAFDALAEDVAIQHASAGTAQSALTLPDTLNADIDGGLDTVTGVTWQSSPAYDGDTAGTYVFTAEIPGEYAVADGVSAPTITVAVEAVAVEADTVVTGMDAGVRTAPGIQLMAADNWSDEANRDTAWTDGAISTAEQLAQFAYLVNTGTYAGENNVWLTADINLAGKEWTPIGNEDANDKTYAGIFNGNGFTVSNMTITYFTGENNVVNLYGLFGLIEGTIKNVNVTGSIICSVTYDYYCYIGGIAGYSYFGSIRNCTSNVDITVNSTTLNASDIGGIVGGNCGEVIGCANYGDIYLKYGNAVYLGGTIGFNVGIIDRCENHGDIESYTPYIGGVVGYSYKETGYYENPSVTNCYNTGDIKDIGNYSYPYYGGIAGYINNTLVENCYNTGSPVNMNAKWGNLIGYLVNASFLENCYFLDNGNSGLGRLANDFISANPGSDMGTELTESQMKALDFVAQLNGTENAFQYNEGGYPVLSSLPITVTINVTPADALVVVKQGYSVIDPETDGTYLLLPGAYEITVSAENYAAQTVSVEITLNEATHTININLVILLADYSAVDAAIARVPSDLSVYTSSSVKALNDAINSVVRGKDITEQDVVDGYAKAINDAIDALYRVYTFTTKFGTFTGTGDLSGTVNGPYDKFVRLLIGVVEVDSKNYTVTEGSTVVTLKESYLKTLANGNYTVTAEFENGTAETTLKVAVKTGTSTSSTASPPTGDNSIIWLWIALTAASLGSLGVLAVISKKRRKRKT